MQLKTRLHINFIFANILTNVKTRYNDFGSFQELPFAVPPNFLPSSECLSIRLTAASLLWEGIMVFVSFSHFELCPTIFVSKLWWEFSSSISEQFSFRILLRVELSLSSLIIHCWASSANWLVDSSKCCSSQVERKYRIL